MSAMGDLRRSSQHGSAAPLAGRGTTILTTKYLRPAKYFKDHPNISRSNQIFQGPTIKTEDHLLLRDYDMRSKSRSLLMKINVNAKGQRF